MSKQGRLFFADGVYCPQVGMEMFDLTCITKKSPDIGGFLIIDYD